MNRNPKGIAKDLFKINKDDFRILKTGHISLMLQIIVRNSYSKWNKFGNTLSRLAREEHIVCLQE